MLVGNVQNKSNFVYFRFRFAGGNKNFIQKKPEKKYYILHFGSNIFLAECILGNWMMDIYLGNLIVDF